MSAFNYNGITLPYPLIRTFRQEVIRDESDTDWCLSRFDIRVEAVLNYNYLSTIVPASFPITPTTAPLQTADAAYIMKAIRERLMEHRKTLSVTFNGTELIPKVQQGLTGTVDAQNGPKPQSCDIFHLGNDTYLVSYRIVAHYWEHNQVFPGTNPPSIVNRQGKPVLYNRWSETVEIDALNFSRRTREGKFIIRSDNPEGKIADFYRIQLAVLSVPTGWLRESSRYTQSPDGLAIQYTVVDREVFKKPPSPAFRAEGSYSEHISKGDGKATATCTIRLFGDKETSQALLVSTAFHVVNQKMLLRGASFTEAPEGAERATLLQAITEVDMYQNVVSYTCQTLFLPANVRLNGVPVDKFKAMARTPLSPANAPYVPNYWKRGTASYLLQAAAYYDPSLGGRLGKGKTTAHSPRVDVGDGQVQMSVPGSANFLPGEAGLRREP